MNEGRILFLTSRYRCGEKMYSILPELSQYFSIDILLNGEMNRNIVWSGDIDPRKNSCKIFEKHCNVIDGWIEPKGCRRFLKKFWMLPPME